MPHSVLSNQVDAHQAQCLPLLVSTPGHPHQAQPMCPLVSNSIETSAGQSASAATTKAVGIPMTSPRASLPFASPNIGSASKVCTVVTPNVEVVIPAGGNDQSNARRKYKCKNCGRVGHSKRSCKLANPILTKATVSGSGQTMPQDKHYVVFVGRVPGIYRLWPECQRQVIRFSENFYHSYPAREEAE